MSEASPTLKGRPAVVVIVAALAVLILAKTANAHHEGMAFLGAKDFAIAGVGKKGVTIDLSQAPGAVRELRLYNNGARVDIRKMIVRYDDGSEHVEDRRFFLQEGERTRAIDKNTRDKFANSITIFLDPEVNRTGIAQLQVRARQTRVGRNKIRGADADRLVTYGKPPSDASTQPPKSPLIEISRIPKDARCGGPRAMLLATGRVGLGTDRDRLALPNAKVGKFEKLRLCVTENAVDLISLDVRYVGGSSEILPVRGRIRKGFRTAAIGLGRDAFIEAFDISYRKRRAISGRARVQIWGELSQTWLDTEAERFNDGWIQLTSGDTAGFVGFEIDTTRVPDHTRGFRQLRINPRNRDITLDYVIASFADGSEQKFAANRIKVEPSNPYGPLTIRNGPKIITKIEARYRSRFFDTDAASRRRAVVEVHGHR